MNLIQFPGCGLETAIVDKYELNRSLRKRASELTVGSSMVRQVNVSFPYGDHTILSAGLDKFLDIADLCMRTVATSIGSTVAPHEWVLLPLNGFDGQLARIGLKGFDLGARVEITSGLQIRPETTPVYFDIQRTLRTASEAFYLDYGVHIPDIQAPSQYLAHQQPDMSLNPITLVDIEPRIVNYV